MVRKRKLTEFTDENFLPSLVAQKEFILQDFDFEYVLSVMSMDSIYKDPITGERSPWMLYTYTLVKELPTIDQLKKLANTLLTGAINCKEKTYISRCGPFRVIKADNRLILDCLLTTSSYD